VGNAQARHKADGYTFSILDDSILERLETYGLDKGVGIEFPPGTKLTELRREIESAISNGSQEVFVADSLEDLAQQIGIDVPVLAATVDEYNRFCAQGRDELFAKEGRYLRPLLGPRFYAVRGRAVFLGTMGGLRVDEKLEVLDKKDDPIPGLYAGGFDAGGMYGDSYPIKSSSGLASAFALNSGRIAGRNALEYLAR
jgi:fumarate reductase flavoprotein subunit